MSYDEARKAVFRAAAKQAGGLSVSKVKRIIQLSGIGRGMVMNERIHNRKDHLLVELDIGRGHMRNQEYIRDFVRDVNGRMIPLFENYFRVGRKTFRDGAYYIQLFPKLDKAKNRAERQQALTGLLMGIQQALDIAVSGQEVPRTVFKRITPSLPVLRKTAGRRETQLIKEIGEYLSKAVYATNETGQVSIALRQALARAKRLPKTLR